MPYSITTRDGITLQGIPDDVPADSPDLKQRVQSIRQQMQTGGGPGGPAGKASDGDKAGGLLMGLRDPIDAGAQVLRRLVPEPVAQAVDAAGNWLADRGLPVARSNGVEGVDKIVRDVNQRYEAGREAAGREGFDWMRLGGNVVNPVNALAAPELGAARTLGALAKAGAKAGAVGGALQPVVEQGDGGFWAEKAKQVAGGAAAGAVATPALARGGEALAKGAKAVAQRAATPPGVNVDVAITNVLRAAGEAEGMDPAQLPKVVLDSVRRQVGEALQAKQKLEPAAILRRAQAEAVGLTGDAAPTLGQMTRSPIQYAQERNMSGVDLGGGKGNPLADRFTLQNQRLGEVFSRAGAPDAADTLAAGQQFMGVLQQANETADNNVRAAYRAFREATGRDLEVPLQGLAQDYAGTLRDFGDVIPGAIRQQFEGLGLLTGKQQRTLSIEDAERLIKVVNQHYDPTNRAQRAALDQLHGAMERAITEAADSAADGASAEAAHLAHEARKTAASVFQARREAPALAAAARGEAPDAFVQRYLLNSPVREVQALAPHLQQNPEAWQQARAQIAETLRRAAFGENLSGDKVFSPERYAALLRKMGPQRLGVFFSPEEVVQLNLTAKVASDINSRPVGAVHAVNNSGTAAAMMNLLSRLSEAPMLRRIPGGRALANQAGEIQTEMQIQRALSAQPPRAPGPELSPEQQRALSRLFPLLGGAAGAAAARPELP